MSLIQRNLPVIVAIAVGVATGIYAFDEPLRLYAGEQNRRAEQAELLRKTANAEQPGAAAAVDSLTGRPVTTMDALDTPPAPAPAPAPPAPPAPVSSSKEQS